MQVHKDPGFNLLPWREELRQQKQQAFLRLLGALVLLAVLTLMLVYLYLTLLIERQKIRSSYLEEKITVRAKQIAEAQQVNLQGEVLLARIRVMQGLEREKLIPVHIFREIARHLDDGVYFTRIAYKDDRLQMKGIAESGSHISAQMRSLADWKLFAEPEVVAINASPDPDSHAGEFLLELSRAAEAGKEEQN